ncbi:MAG: universal stress protein [Synechococcales bacterium]|nr:universal stress protein [Synechococcales bacterium]
MLKTSVHRILVALDPASGHHDAQEDLSQQVMETLKQFQLSDRHKVILSHVVPIEHSEVDIIADRPSVELELPYDRLTQHLQHYQKQLSCPSELEIVAGDPAEEIIRLAKIHQVDLIVLGSRGLTGMQRIVMGSVSSQVFADAPCSVLVVKPTERTERFL